MRAAFTVIHRWAGLFIAVFLTISGLTGAIISWDHELDEFVNPHLYDAKQPGTPLDPLALAAKVQNSDPKARVTFFPLSFEDGHNASYFVEPRIDPKTGEPFTLDYNQVFVDPATGDIAGKRFWGAVSLDRENILPFLYKLHYSMHIPDSFNIVDLGVWVMGIVAIVWTFDCFVGFYLTLPQQTSSALATGQLANSSDQRQGRTWFERWRPAWKIKRGAKFYRRNLDLHRVFGLWLWLLLFLIAFTSISMNLGDEIVRPALRSVATLTPDAFNDVTGAQRNQPVEPKIGFHTAINIAEAEARRRTWEEPAGNVFYGLQHGLYAVQFFHPGDDHGSGGMGVKMLFVDAADGSLQGGRVPWEGTAADIFMQLQFPLHSGRIAGLPGRILLSIMGLAVAILSITGIIVWFKKRGSRMSLARSGVRPRNANGLRARWEGPLGL